MANLTAVAQYGTGGASTRTRLTQWLDFTGLHADLFLHADLADNRPQSLVHAWLPVARAELDIRRRPRHTERLFIQRGMSPFSNGSVEESWMRRSDFAVYDFDDALMWTRRKGAQRIWSRAETCLRSVIAADRVIAGSEVLADWASAHNSDVLLIPTCVDTTTVDPKQQYSIEDTPRLVWIGSPSTEKYLEYIAEPLRRAHVETGLRITVISAGSRLLAGIDDIVDRVAWRPGIELTLPSYDIAIAPLLDGPMERGKCAYKILQYGAAGLPIVGSPVGANDTVLRDLGGISAASQSAWLESLVGLVGAPESERSHRGLAGRTATESGYSYTAWSEAWLSAVLNRRSGSEGRGTHPLRLS